MAATKKKPGRPRTRNYDDKGEWVSLGLRLPRAVKEQLDAVAAANRHSQTDEATRTLVNAFDAKVAHQEIEYLALIIATLKRASGKSWLEDAGMCAAIEDMTSAFLRRYGPSEFRERPVPGALEAADRRARADAALDNLANNLGVGPRKEQAQ